MIKQYTVSIPTNPYLRSFISAHCGDPVIIDNNSLLGCFLIGVMGKTSMRGLNLPKKDIRYSFFTEKITCMAPQSMIYHFGFSLNAEQVIQINRYFENLFDEQLYFWCQKHINHNSRYKGYKQAIESFCEKYNIPLYDTVSFDSLQKSEYRYRKFFENNLATFSTQKQVNNQLLFQ